MGRIARLLQFIRGERNGTPVSEAKVNLGGQHTVQADCFQPAGDDSQPLVTDYVVTLPVVGSGRLAAVGYADPINAGEAGPGEKRIYARDPSDGSIVAVFWLKSDGSVVWSNANGTATLSPAGDFNFNGVVIAADGSVTVPSSLELDGKELADHTHGGVQTGGGNTGPNN